MESMFEGTTLPPIKDKDIDGYLTIAFTLFVGFLVLDIAFAFRKTWRQQPRRLRKFSREHWKMYILLALAAASLFVVIGMRLELQRAKVPIWNQVRELRREVEELAGEIFHDPKAQVEIPNTLAGRFWRPDIHPSRLADKCRKWLSTVYGEQKKLVYALLHKAEHIEAIPWVKHDWVHSDSIWDHFKMLVSNFRRFWWTQQWYMGYTAWVMFVVNECSRRNIPVTVALSFIALAYISSFVSVQCLFYALLLLDHTGRGGVRHPPPQPLAAVAAFADQALQVASLPYLLKGTIAKDHSSELINAMQISVFLVPLAWRLVRSEMPSKIRKRIPEADFIHSAKVMWFLCLTVALILHVHATYQADYESKADSLSLWSVFNSRKWDHSSGVDDVKKTAKTIFNSLGEHHWVNALGIDVLFSAIALCCWVVFAHKQSKDMAECAFYPVIKAGTFVEEQITRETEGVIVGLQSAGQNAKNTAVNLAFTASNEIRKRTNSIGSTVAGVGSQLHDMVSGQDRDYDESLLSSRQTRGRARKSTARQTSSRANSSSRPTRSASANGTTGAARTRSQSRASISPTKKSGSRRRSSRVRTSMVARGSDTEDEQYQRVHGRRRKDSEALARVVRTVKPSAQAEAAAKAVASRVDSVFLAG